MKLIPESDLRYIVGVGDPDQLPFALEWFKDSVLVLGSFGLGALVGAISALRLSKQATVSIV
ncbi:MAG: hypothetical protein U1E78_09730 [Gammaproteobacteria bacterium]